MLWGIRQNVYTVYSKQEFRVPTYRELFRRKDTVDDRTGDELLEDVLRGLDRYTEGKEENE